jgi:hypothetical protein
VGLRGHLPGQLTRKLVEVGDLRAALLRFFCLLDSNDPSFPIVTPRSDARMVLDHLQDLAGLVEGTASEESMMAHSAVKQARLFFAELPRGC